MGVPTWDEYVFENFKIVAVDPWCGASLTLLDAFTMDGTHGRIFNHGPNLAHRGALTGLTKEGGPAQVQARTNLDEARMGRGGHVQSIDQVPMVATLKSSSKLLASLANIVSADSTKSKSLVAEVSDVTSESINQDFLSEQVQGGRWKPDPKKSLMPQNWDGVLWVVKEIYYAKKLIIGKTKAAIAKISVDPSKLGALTEPLPVNLKGKIEVSQAKDGTTVLEVPENGRPFPIGFKAIRLFYDKNGELLAPGGIKLDMGKDRPKTRSAINEWLDPDKDKNYVYHMEELFTQEPGGPMVALPMLMAEGATAAEGSVSTALEATAAQD